MFAGILYATQCTKVPPGESGSSTIIAKLFISFEGLSQLSDGDIFLPSHVYFGDINSPFLKDELVKLILYHFNFLFVYLCNN